MQSGSSPSNPTMTHSSNTTITYNRTTADGTTETFNVSTNSSQISIQIPPGSPLLSSITISPQPHSDHKDTSLLPPPYLTAETQDDEQDHFENMTYQSTTTTSTNPSLELYNDSDNSSDDSDDESEYEIIPSNTQLNNTQPTSTSITSKDAIISEPRIEETVESSEETGEYTIVNIKDGENYNFDTGTQELPSNLLWRAKMVCKYTVKPSVKKLGLIAAASIPPLALAFNAFCAFPHLKTADLSIEQIKALSPGILGLCITNGLASYSINTVLNYGTIPNAFNMFYERMWLHFKKHPIQNSAIFTLAAGAGISAAAVGYASFLPLGTTLAWTNFTTNGFIFFVTRFYGLVNALHRLEKSMSHRYQPNSLLSNTFDDLLSHVTDDCAAELNAFLLKRQSGIDEDTITELLKELNKVMNKDPSVIKAKTKTEILGKVFDIAAATGAGLAVFFAFAKKFLDGLDQLVALFTHEEKSTVVNELATGYKALLSFFSIATSILYTGQTLLLRQTVTNAYDAIHDPKLSTGQKIMKSTQAAGLLLGNGFACTSVYNLTETSFNEPNNMTESIIPADSMATRIDEILAAAAAFAVNTKLSVEKVLPAPKESTHPILERTASSANLPDLTRQTSNSPTLPLPTITEEDEPSKHEDKSSSSSSIITTADLTQKPTRKTSQEQAPQEVNKELKKALKWLNTHTLSHPKLNELHTHHTELYKNNPTTLFQPAPTLSSTKGSNNLTEPLLNFIRLEK